MVISLIVLVQTLKDCSIVHFEDKNQDNFARHFERGEGPGDEFGRLVPIYVTYVRALRVYTQNTVLSKILRYSKTTVVS